MFSLRAIWACTFLFVTNRDRTSARPVAIEISHERNDERAHLRGFGNHLDFDSMHLQNGVASGSDGCDDDVLVEGPYEIALPPESLSDLEQMAKLDLASHRERIVLARDDALDEALESRGVLWKPPAIEPLLVDDRLPGDEGLGERIASLSIVEE